VRFTFVPHSDRAMGDIGKIEDYRLSPSHPRGRTRVREAYQGSITMSGETRSTAARSRSTTSGWRPMVPSGTPNRCPILTSAGCFRAQGNLAAALDSYKAAHAIREPSSGRILEMPAGRMISHSPILTSAG
jgi:hypothetical protein